MNYYFLGLIFVAVLFEVAADILFKSWSSTNKTLVFWSGLGLYTIGTLLWAYSLKFEFLSKAISVFTVLNFIMVAAAGIIVFHEPLTSPAKIGIVLGIISVILLQL